MRVAQLCFVLASVLGSVSAHIALWDEGMYGWDPNDPNQSEPVLPLMNLPFSQWWFHGYINKPPQDGKFMTLPSGGTYHGQVACNKALTTYGQNDYQQTGLYACDGDGPSGGIGAMHTSDQWESPNPTDVKGCGIAIAYESDVTKIKPEDFTVITVNYTCPWFKHVDFQIPDDLPPCPEGGCHCMWGWVHAADAGSEQMYFNGYRCNVSGATGTTPIPQAKTANKCHYPEDKTNCTVGAKQPHYWYQTEGNNNPQGTYDPPFYNGDYGFINGAQTDLFAALGGVTESSSASSVAASTAAPAPTVTASSTTTTSIPADTATSSATTGTATTLQTSSSSSSSSSPSSSSSTTASTQAATTTSTTSTSPSPTPNTSTTPTSTNTSTAVVTPVAVSDVKTCSRRKRSLSQLLDSPEAVRRHRLRNEKRRERMRRRQLEQGGM
ncbi:hypothetical protein CI109_101767 [Kwoniella shandongensis]|uniref:Uncharacterized protein n=1 Tax=Kwoniella shandongensis TaxID=1734106 RepID=A0A5M6C6E5_9TREE|nr:uncharacterized protein CI109_001111 [Kwoniella shandongensis]KAA5530310.1 hypothetical protein CI109_001111 [Kwoniella shandongensis]